MSLLQTLKKELLTVVNDINVGNTNLDEKEMNEIIEVLRKYNTRDNMISKYQAYTYLNISRATFDRLVKDGRLPKGKKVAGFKELMWSERSIKNSVNKDTLPR